MKDLKIKTISGVYWNTFTKFITQGTQFVFGLILARLLIPEDYGLVGMLAIFIAISQTFIESGLGTVLIMKKEPTDVDFSTVFWFNFIVSLFAYSILFISAPFIANFYHHDQLIPLVRILSITIIINAFGMVQGKYLNKYLYFRKLNKIYIISFISGSVVAVIMAWQGFGVWALVGRAILIAVFLNFGWWLVSPWHPKVIFSYASFKQLFRKSSKLLGSGIIDAAFQNLYNVVIGKVFSAQELGYFTRASQFQRLPDTFSRQIIMGVFFPVLSHIQDDNAKLISVYKKLIKVLAFILYPSFAILGLIAYPLIAVILSNKWLPSAPLLQIMVLLGLFFPFESINLNILYIKGRSDYILKVNIFRKIILIIVIAISYHWGVIGMVWGLVVDAFLGIIITYFYSFKFIKYSLFAQCKDIAPYFVYSIVLIIPGIFLFHIIDNEWLQLLFIPFEVLAVYFILNWLFNKNQMLEFISYYKDFKNRKKINA